MKQQKRKSFTVRMDEQEFNNLQIQAKSFKPKKSVQQHLEGIIILHNELTHQDRVKK